MIFDVADRIARITFVFNDQLLKSSLIPNTPGNSNSVVQIKGLTKLFIFVIKRQIIKKVYLTSRHGLSWAHALSQQLIRHSLSHSHFPQCVCVFGSLHTLTQTRAAAYAVFLASGPVQQQQKYC